MITMLGGLHVEKALWYSVGDLLAFSGWTEALTEADVATSGTAVSFLKASHITRTRHAHQVTALALSKLQQDAFALSDSKDFEAWRLKMIKDSPTFHYWDLILKKEVQVLIFIRANRERNFPLYTESLESLVYIFFALNHYNYSRWASIHLRDVKSLPDCAKETFCQNWVLQKTTNRFSAIPLDHAQENAKVKGKGGVVGLTENPTALKRWMIAGPEFARLNTELESLFLPEMDPDVNSRHHEEGLALQQSFKKQVTGLIHVIEDFGNLFIDSGPELVVLNTRDCVSYEAASSVHQVEVLGKLQYDEFKKEVIDAGGKRIHKSIKKNGLPLFSSPKAKKTSNKAQKISDLRDDVALFGRLFIANQLRDGDPDVFFSDENQLHPPSLSDHEKIRVCKKSDLIKCLKPTEESIRKDFDCKIFDGAALIHMLKPNAAKSFQEYAEKVFVKFIQWQLQSLKRIDIVWDRYLANSIKGSAREKRGVGLDGKLVPNQT